MPLNNTSQTQGTNKRNNIFRSAMNARFFICATMVMAQVIGSMFGFGMVSVNELFSIPATHAAEGIAHTINYQGKLMDSSGGIVSDGNYDMKFSIYDSASGGSQLWTASSTLGIPTGTPENVSVAVENGLFSLLLGDTSSDQVAFPDDLFNKDELYLGVTIGSDSEMTPRKRLSAVPYAYNSEMLQGQHASGTVDGSLGGDLFALNQNSDTPASATRTALGIYTSGTSDTYDYLIRGNSGSDVFTVTRAGNVSTTGNLQVDGATIVGSATTTAVTFNGYVSSDFNPYSDLTYNLGSSAYRWLGLNVANVTSTNVTTTNLAAGYVTTSELWVGGTQITGAGSTSNLQQVTDVGATTTNWVQFAGATSTDNLVPGTTLSYDLGSSAYRWNDLWVSSTYIGDATWNLREDANNYFTIADVGGSERVTVDTSGNVGINNASPAAKLDVVSSDFPVGKFTRQTTATNVPNSGYLLHTQSSGNMSDGFGGGIVFSLQDDTSAEENIATLYAVRDGADDSGALEFHTYLNGSRNERMVIDSAGYIGINATNPATRLQVGSESSSASEGIRIQSDADAYMELIADDNNNGEDNNPYIYFSQDGASITGIMGVTGVDNEAPNGSSYTGVLDNSMLIGHSYSEGLLQFGTNNSVKMTIDQGGNVGIGTTNPSSFKLQVAGNVGPETNNTYDLGSPALSWRNLYVSGTTAFNNVVYTWSPTQGAVDTYLKNDGSGNLTWETISGVSTPSWQEVTDVGATTTDWIQFAGATSTDSIIITVKTPTFLGAVQDSEEINGTADYLDAPYGIAVQDDYLYAASFDDDAFSIFDYSDPNNIVQIGTIKDDDSSCPSGNCELNGAFDVVISGYYAYVSSYDDDGIQIIDISDPSNPTHAGYLRDAVEVTELNGPREMVINGKYLYVAAAESDSFTILDISDPVNPIELDYICDNESPSCPVGKELAQALEGANNVFVDNGYAYVSSIYDDGFDIFDVSNPNNITYQSSVVHGGVASHLADARGIHVTGKYAYVAAYGSNSLSIFDISSSTNPLETGYLLETSCSSECELDGPTEISVYGDYAYITGYDDDGIEIVDISSSTNPTHAAAYADDGSSLLDAPYNLHIQGDKLFVTANLDNGNSNAINIFSLSSLKAPSANIGSLNANQFEVTDNALIGNNLFVTNGVNIGGTLSVHGGISGGMLDISGATTSFNGVDYYWPGADGTNGYVLKTDSNGNLSWDTNAATLQEVTDLGNMTNDSIYQTYATPTIAGYIRDDVQGGDADYIEYIYDLDYKGDFAFVVSSENALSVFDISSSTNPTQVSALTDGTGGASLNSPRGIHVVGDYAYIASVSDGGLEVVDISDPYNPTHVGFEGSMPYVDTVKVSGGYAVLSADYSAEYVYFVDVSDPTNPTKVYTYNLSNADTFGSAISGNYFFLTHQSNRLMIFDMSDPTAPTVTNLTDNTYLDMPRDVDVMGNYAYVVSIDQDNMAIVDISDPNNPSVVGSIANSDDAYYKLSDPEKIKVKGNYAYISATGEDAIAIIDITSSTNPVYVSHISDSNPPYLNETHALEVTDSGLILAGDNSEDTLNIIEMTRLVTPSADIDLLRSLNFENDQQAHFKGEVYIGDHLSLNGVPYIFPIQDGTSGHVLQTDSSGNLSWVTNAVPLQEVTDLGNMTNDSIYQTFATPTLMSIVRDESQGSEWATTTLEYPHSVKVRGNIAYVLSRADHALVTYDISSSTNPVYMDSIVNGGSVYLFNAYKMVLEGDYAYIITSDSSSSRFEIVDISDPYNLTHVGSLTGLGYLSSIAYYNGYIYAGRTYYNPDLYVIDVRDPTNPSLVTDYTDGSLKIQNPRAMVAYDEVLFVTADDTSDYITALDISDPANITQISTFTDPALDFMVNLEIRGDVLYGASKSSDCFWSVDISDPSSMSVLDSLCSISYLEGASEFDIGGNYAYINADYSDMITIVDISSSTNLTYVLSITDDNISGNGDIAISDSGLLVNVDGNTDTMHTFELTRHTAPAADLDLLHSQDFTNTGNATFFGNVSIGSKLSLNSVDYIFPSIDGTDSDILKTDGAGNLTWGAYDTLSINSGDLSLVGYLHDDANTEMSNMQDVFVRGDYAYIAGGYDDGFQIVDISDPTNPQPLGKMVDQVPTTDVHLDNAFSVFVNGDYAYVTSYENDALEIIDVSDPYNPTHVGSKQSGLLNQARGLYVSGRYAYVTASYADSLVVIDVSDPTTPTIVGSLVDGTNLDGAYDVNIQGNYAYVTAYTGDNLAVVDISNPSNPQLISTLDDGAGASELNGPKGIDVIGKYAYIASDEDDAFVIVDISSSTNPVEVGTLLDGGTALLNGPHDVKVAGDYAFVAVWDDHALVVLDISDPTNPTYVTQYTSLTYAERSSAVFVENGYVYLNSEYDGLSIFNIPTFKAPTAEIGDLAADNFTVYNDAFFNNDVYVSDGLLVDGNILSNSALSALELKITSPTTSFNGVEYYWPESDGAHSGNVLKTDGSGNLSWGVYDTLGINSGDLTIDGYICDTESSYCDPAYEKLSRLQDPYGLAIQGDIAYVLGYNDDGFVVLDISDPNNPSQIAMVTHGTYLNNPRDIFVNGDYAYITTYYDRVSIYNISDPANPTYTGSYYNNPYLSDSYEIVVSGKYAYIVSVGDERLVILDVSDPANPTFVSSLTGITDPYFVDVKGKYAYVTGYTSNNLSIIDISNPSSPTIVGSISDSTGSTVLDGALGLDVVGHFAYVASYDEDAIGIFDISSSTNPVEVGYLRDGVGGAVLNGARDIKIEGNYAYIASTLEDSIAVIDISSSTNPTHVTSIGNTVNLNNPVRLQVANGKVYTVSVVSESFSILDIPTFTAASAVIGDLNATNFTVYNDAFFNNDVYISDGLIIDGTVQANDDISTAQGLFANTTSSMAGILPHTTDIYDLGSNSYWWRDIYVSGIAYLNAINTQELNALPTNLELQSTITPLGDTYSIDVQGDYLYSVENWDALRIYNVQDPEHPQEISSLTGVFGTNPTLVEVSGNYAFVMGSSDSYLAAVDVSDPANPVLIDTLTSGDDYEYTNDIVISGKYLYAAHWHTDRMHIYDISDPYNMSFVGWTPAFTGDTKAVDVQGDYAYVVEAGSDSLWIFDVTDPTNPTSVSSTVLGSIDLQDVVVSGNYAYVADSSNVHIIDISDKTAPTTTASLATTNNVSLYIANNYLYAGGSSNFYTIDISSSTAPSIVETISSVGTVYDIEVKGRELFMARTNTDQIRIYDVKGAYVNGLNANSADLGSLTVMDGARFDKEVSIRGGLDVGSQGIYTEGILSAGDGFETVATSTFGHVLPDANNTYDLGSSSNYWRDIYVNNISTQEVTALPTSLELDSVISAAGNIFSIDVQGDYLYSVENWDELRIYNTQDANNPELVGNLSGLGINATYVAVQGNYAFVGRSGSAGIYTIDISDPANPTLLATYTGTGDYYADDMKINGRYLYKVNHGTDRMHIFDISDPVNIVHVGQSASFGNDIKAVDIQGKYAYIAEGATDSLWIYDITDPTNPVSIASTDFGTIEVYDVVVSGNYAYVADNSNIHIVDISDKTAPTTTASLATTNNRSLHIANNYLYAGGTSNLYTIDISSSTAPSIVDTVTSVGDILEIRTIGRKLFAARDGADQIRIYDVKGVYTNGLMANSADIGTLTVMNGARFDNEVSIRGGLDVGIGGIITNGNLAVSATSTFQDIEVNGYVNSDLIPAIDNTYWLGTSTKMWKGLVAGTVSTTNLIVNGVPFNGLSVAGTDNRVVRMDGNDQIQDSLIVLDDTGNFYPVNSNSQDLGLTTNRWDDIWGAEVHIGTSTWDISQLADGSYSMTNSSLSYMKIGTGSSHNTAIGFDAGDSITTGVANISIGSEATTVLENGSRNTSIGNSAFGTFLGGNDNTALGAFSLYGAGGDQTATANTAVGSYSMYKTNTGGYNSSLGHYSLYALTDGSANDAFGYSAGSAITTGRSNAAIGSQSLSYNETGSNNVAVGATALAGSSGNSHSYNTAVGVGSLRYIRTGASNTAMGYESLHNNTTGDNNVALGSQALYSNTGLNNQIAIGANSMYSNTAGLSNIGIGAWTLYRNVNGRDNVALGYAALSGVGGSHSYNTAIGSNAMNIISTGSHNTALGSYALHDVATGASNTAVGFESLYSNTSGFQNSAFGLSALKSNRTGFNNNAVGASALASITDSNRNNAFGSGALANLTSGDYNTVMGNAAGSRLTKGSHNVGIGARSLSANTIGATYEFDANTAVGAYSLGELTTGASNTAIGTYSGRRIKTGYENVSVGVNSLSSLSGTGYGNVALGYNAAKLVVNGTENIAIGDEAMASTTASAGNIAIGWKAMRNIGSGMNTNIAMGILAMQDASDADYSIGLGYYALAYATGSNSIGIGQNALGYNGESGNVAIGSGAGSSNTFGKYFTAVGRAAGTNNTTGYWNTYLGYDSGHGSTIGGVNTAVGAQALYDNSTGGYNTGIGQGALYELDSGSYNTAVGAQAGFNVSTAASYNTSLGYKALYGADAGGTTGNYNTAIGSKVLEDNTSGYENVGVGANVLIQNTVGFKNTGLGTGALGSNVGGASNTAVGYQASVFNVAGKDNVAVGMAAMRGNSGNSHNYNTAVGSESLFSVTTASYNTAVGRRALNANGTGYYNTAVGNSALQNATGGTNVALGSFAGNSITSGTGNTFIGYNTDGGKSDIYNATALGYNVTVVTSSYAHIGNSQTIGGSSPWNVFSDARLKYDVQDNDLGIQFINKLDTKKFRFTATSTMANAGALEDGLIAQEVEQAMNDLGVHFSGLVTPNFTGNYYQLSYEKFTVPLIKATQELYASSSPLFNGIEINPSFVALEEPFMQVDLDGNISYKGTSITAKGTATTSTTSFDSYTFSYQGSAWNNDTAQEITTSFDVYNNTIHASSSELKFIYTTGTGFSQDLLTITNSGDVHVSGDLHVGRRLYLGSKSTGEGSTSTYIFVDDTLAPTSTYIATNADGWQTATTYDYAERYESLEELQPGDLVTADSSGVNLVKRATSANQPMLGIVSTKPGFVTGRHYDGWHPVALAGRVPTRVSTINGAIKAGDYISASDIPGVGVKATGAGNVVGIALESYDLAEEGLISVFVKPSFSMGSISTSGESAGTIITQPQQTTESRVEIEGLALIRAGSTEVHISYGTILHYPMVYATPHASMDGSWWITNRTDKGFDIIISQEQTHDVEFTWLVRPMNSGTIRFVSDNTYHAVDDLTGQPIGPTMDELLTSTSTDDGTTTSTDMGTSTSTDDGTTTTSTEPVVSGDEPATSSTTMVSSTDTTSSTDATASSTEPVTGGDAAAS